VADTARSFEDFTERVQRKLASVGVSVPGDAELVEWLNDGTEAFAEVTKWFYATSTGYTSSSTNAYNFQDIVDADGNEGTVLELLRIWVEDDEIEIKSWEWLNQKQYYKWRSKTGTNVYYAYQDTQDTFSFYYPSDSNSDEIRIAYSYIPARKVYVNSTTTTWYTVAVDTPREVDRHIVNYCVGAVFLKMGVEAKGQAFLNAAMAGFRGFASRHNPTVAADTEFVLPDKLYG